MEDSSTKDQSSGSGRSTSRLLRYPLRSATRSKEEKPPAADSMNSHSATKRVRPASSVVKSMGVLDLSGKGKTAKPPRRLSVPSKSNATTPASKSLGNITPISEARSRRSAINQGKSDASLSDISNSSFRKKFGGISSALYWLSQIKLSESAAKHSISLGFFKLALEAGCQPVQKMRDELKSYARCHNLSGSELGETLKELFENYNVIESNEPSEASKTCFEVPPEPNRRSDDDVNSSSSSITNAEKLKPLSGDVNSEEIQQDKKSNNEITKKDDSVRKTRKSVSKTASSLKSGTGGSLQKKPQKPVKQESGKDNNGKVKKQGKKYAGGEGGDSNEPFISDTVAGAMNSPPKEALQENKENMA